jgi:uncharacterized protein HemX
MKATALIAAAALAFGSAAFAQQQTDKTARGEENARVEQQDHGSAGQKMRNGLHRLGEKTRHAMHRIGDKLHASRDHHGDRMHASRDDTRAMGASGEDQGRRQRMDDAYANWQAKHDKAEQKR